MYRNVLGEKVSKGRFQEMQAAAKNRREFIAAGLGRRDLMKMGLLTAAGTLLPIKGLSARRSPGSVRSSALPRHRSMWTLIETRF